MLTWRLEVNESIFANENIETWNKVKFSMDGFIKWTLNLTKELKSTKDYKENKNI